MDIACLFLSEKQLYLQLILYKEYEYDVSVRLSDLFFLIEPTQKLPAYHSFYNYILCIYEVTYSNPFPAGVKVSIFQHRLYSYNIRRRLLQMLTYCGSRSS